MTDMTTVKNCFKDPKASECTGKHNYYNYLNYNQEHYSNYLGTYGGTATLPTVLAGKCDGATCTTLNTDMTAVKSCLTNPTASSCTGAYQRQYNRDRPVLSHAIQYLAHAHGTFVRCVLFLPSNLNT